jgi:cell division protein FtsN
MAKPVPEDGHYRFRVQTGTFRDYDSAFRLQRQLFHRGYTADIIRKGRLYAVLAGDYPDMNEAVRTEIRLRNSGYDTLLIMAGKTGDN